MSDKQTTERIITSTMEEVIHNSMIPYAEYVIMDRAIPRVEDGLKPVQRRILYTMIELGITPDKPFRKSARIVGDCLGKFHPHGDSSVYDAMVRMAQDFSMGECLVDGQGNFGSIDGDSAAAMRYTEARLSPLAMELLKDIDKETVNFVNNFDDTLKEPQILPGRFPNLLVNGSSGIAVGLATNIPPHNLGEVIDGVIAYINKPTITTLELMDYICAPDFPGGGYVICGDGLRTAYESGKGKIVVRAKVYIENGDNDKKNIVISQLPYQVNKATLLQKVLALREEKKDDFIGISEIVDESDRNGMRAVIRIKKDYDPRKILDELFKRTELEKAFHFNMVAIAGGKPRQMGIFDIIKYYSNYQKDIVLKRSKYEIEGAEARCHVLEGLVIAVLNIDEVVRIIKASAAVSEAKSSLRKAFSLSEIQAQGILDMKLSRLTGLEIFKLEKELKELKLLIARLRGIIQSEKLQWEVVVSELTEIKNKFASPRKSKVFSDSEVILIPSDDDEKTVEDVFVSLTANNGFKMQKMSNVSDNSYMLFNGAGFGEVNKLGLLSKTNTNILAFTNFGVGYKINTSDLSLLKLREKGQALASLDIKLKIGEKIVGLADLSSENFVFVTKMGQVKKTLAKEYDIRNSSLSAIKLKDGDEVVNVFTENESFLISLTSKSGNIVVFNTEEIPLQGRNSGGVIGIILADDDSVVMANCFYADGYIGLVTSKGFGKTLHSEQVPISKRARKGVILISLSKGEQILSVITYLKDKTIVALSDTEETTVLSTADITQLKREQKQKQIPQVNFFEKVNEVVEHIEPFKK